MSYRITINAMVVECASPAEVLALTGQKTDGGEMLLIRRLSEAEQGQAAVMLAQGMGKSAIARKFQVSVDVIRRLDKREKKKQQTPEDTDLFPARTSAPRTRTPIAESNKTKSGRVRITDELKAEIERLLQMGTMHVAEIAASVGTSAESVYIIKTALEKSGHTIAMPKRRPRNPSATKPVHVEPKGRKASPNSKDVVPDKGTKCESCEKFMAVVKCAGCDKMICGLCTRKNNGQCAECKEIPE